MNHKVGIWIDHKKAGIVSASADRVTAKTLESEVGAPARYSGRAGDPTPDGAGRPAEARKNTKSATASILTGTTTRSSVNWGNRRLF